jgi:hypothetical protein
MGDGVDTGVVVCAGALDFPQAARINRAAISDPINNRLNL